MIGIERAMRKVDYFIEREMRKNLLFYWKGKEYDYECKLWRECGGPWE